MSDPYMIYDADEAQIRFVWSGGAYIEHGPIPAPDEEFSPVDVLNVWDYAKGEPNVERTLGAFRTHCEEKLKEIAVERATTELRDLGRDELAAHLEADTDPNELRREVRGWCLRDEDRQRLCDILDPICDV